MDTSARIAVLGAGPVGLEAALYARYLGHEVDVYERGRVADNVLRWGHVRMFSPGALNCSPLGLAALEAQDPSYRPPEGDALLTARQWAESYLLPLSRTDLLHDCLHEQTAVVTVGRAGLLKGDLIGTGDRAGYSFRILLRGCEKIGTGTSRLHKKPEKTVCQFGASPIFSQPLCDDQERERVAEADIVIDATGTYGNHCWLGGGGIPAVGEQAAKRHIEYGLPDISGVDRDRYAARHTLLVGGGYSAATHAVALTELAEQEPRTRITWITRRPRGEDAAGPIPRIPNDRLPERDQLARAANQLAAAAKGPITHWPGTAVEAIHWDGDADSFHVQLAGPRAGPCRVDRIIANVGYQPERSLYDQLQVHECYVSGGPMKLAASLLEHASADCLDQPPCGAQTLVNPEPNFYILGSKSYGRNSNFLVSVGLEQIRQLFTLIAAREDLDLYASIASHQP